MISFVHLLRYSSLFHAIRALYTEEGLSALYRGFSPALLGIIPYSGTAFFTFETLKETCLGKKSFFISFLYLFTIDRLFLFFPIKHFILTLVLLKLLF